MSLATVLKQLIRAALFSFGIAICLFVLISVASTVATGGERSLDPDDARTVFTTAFVISLIFFVAVKMLRTKSRSQDDDADAEIR